MSTPPWPSLYNPSVELITIPGQDPIQPAATYLYDPTDVFKFMFYWTLVFYTPLFSLCGFYAFINIVFPPKLARLRMKRDVDEAFPLMPMRKPAFPFKRERTTRSLPIERRESTFAASNDQPSPAGPPSINSPMSVRVSPPIRNPRRTRFAFALIVLFTFLASGVVGALVGSAVIGYVLSGLFRAGHFNMSTWIPFLFALVQTLIGLLGVWPSVVEII